MDNNQQKQTAGAAEQAPVFNSRKVRLYVELHEGVVNNFASLISAIATINSQVQDISKMNWAYTKAKEHVEHLNESVPVEENADYQCMCDFPVNTSQINIVRKGSAHIPLLTINKIEL